MISKRNGFFKGGYFYGKFYQSSVCLDNSVCDTAVVQSVKQQNLFCTLALMMGLQ